MTFYFFICLACLKYDVPYGFSGLISFSALFIYYSFYKRRIFSSVAFILIYVICLFFYFLKFSSLHNFLRSHFRYVFSMIYVLFLLLISHLFFKALDFYSFIFTTFTFFLLIQPADRTLGHLPQQMIVWFRA